MHSLGSPEFEDTDRENAENFAEAAKRAGVQRLVYLGGLTPGGDDVSPHLRSRTEVGDILLGSGVPTIAFRAAIIIGSGSASFEMLRYLTERLPVMVTPRWVRSRIQPIAIRDVLRYLVEAATHRSAGQPQLRHRRPGRADVRADDAALCAASPASSIGSSSR